MTRAKSPASKLDDEKPARSKTPDVIVGTLFFEQGLFFIAVKNISEQPAYKVSVKFNEEAIRTVAARGKFRRAPLSQHRVPRSAEGKSQRSSTVVIPILRASSLLKLKAQLSYHDAEGDKHGVSIAHDLKGTETWP